MFYEGSRANNETVLEVPANEFQKDPSKASYFVADYKKPLSKEIIDANEHLIPIYSHDKEYAHDVRLHRKEKNE